MTLVGVKIQEFPSKARERELNHLVTRQTALTRIPFFCGIRFLAARSWRLRETHDTVQYDNAVSHLATVSVQSAKCKEGPSDFFSLSSLILAHSFFAWSPLARASKLSRRRLRGPRRCATASIPPKLSLLSLGARCSCPIRAL